MQPEKDKIEPIVSPCTKCAKKRENPDEKLCKNCLREKQEWDKLNNCTQCGLNDKYNHYEECMQCRAKNYEAKDNEMKRL